MSPLKANIVEYPTELIGNISARKDVLLDRDGALMFVFLTNWNTLTIAYLCDEGEQALRYIVAPTNQLIINRLKSGAISIREALEQPIMWLVDVNSSEQVVGSWIIQAHDLPDNALPGKDVLLTDYTMTETEKRIVWLKKALVTPWFVLYLFAMLAFILLNLGSSKMHNPPFLDCSH